jgi:hypothetical protein
VFAQHRPNWPSQTTPDASNPITIYTPPPRLGRQGCIVQRRHQDLHHRRHESPLPPTQSGPRSPPIGSNHHHNQRYRLCAPPRSHWRGATRGIDAAFSVAEAGVIGYAPPSSTSWGGGSVCGEVDPHLLQQGGEREISLAVAQWNQRWRCGGLDCEGSHHRLQSYVLTIVIQVVTEFCCNCNISI